MGWSRDATLGTVGLGAAGSNLGPVTEPEPRGPVRFYPKQERVSLPPRDLLRASVELGPVPANNIPTLHPCPCAMWAPLWVSDSASLLVSWRRLLCLVVAPRPLGVMLVPLPVGGAVFSQ